MGWFLEEVWPALRAAAGPGAHLVVAGQRPPGGRWHSSVADGSSERTAGVRVLGFVADLQPLLDRARVAVSPVTVGSGFNTKNLLALGAGLPLVTTSAGSAGLPPGAAVVAGGAELDGAAFAAAAAALHRDAQAWEVQGRAGYEAAERTFSRAAVSRELTGALAAAAEAQPRPRLRATGEEPRPAVLILTRKKSKKR